MIESKGLIRVIFSHSDIRYDLTVQDITDAMDSPDPVLPTPSPPQLLHSYTTSLHLHWILPFAVGVIQRVEVQYSSASSSDDIIIGSSQLGGIQWQALASKMWESPGFLSHVIEELSPGLNFVFRLRFWTPRGWSPWSKESTPYKTLCDIPSTPAAPMCMLLLPEAAQICWARPSANGSPITTFLLRGRGIGGEDEYTELYRGPALSHLVLRLHPESAYSFEVAAINDQGPSAFSERLSVHTPAKSSASTGGGVERGAQALRCPQAWSECWDAATGTPFYFNVITGTRQVDRPEALGGPVVNNDSGGLDKDGGQAEPVAVEEEQDPLVAKEKKFRVKRYRFLRALLFGNHEQDVTSSTTENRSPTTSNKSPSYTLTIRREHLLFDLYDQLSRASVSDLRGELSRRQRTKVVFVDEPGLDAGGPARELFLLGSQELVALGLARCWLRTCSSEGSLFFREPYLPPGRKDAKRKYNLDAIPAPKLSAVLGRLTALAVLDRQMLQLPLVTTAVLVSTNHFHDGCIL